MITKQLIRCTNSIGELLLIYALVLLVGGALYAWVEAKSFYDGLWWAAVTATTTGYGDMYPATLAGRFVAFVLMNVNLIFILPLLIGRMITALIEDQDKFTDAEQRQLLSDVAENKRLLLDLKQRLDQQQP